jgi:hypothetical protein
LSMDYLSCVICWGYDPSRMADSIGAVIGIKGEECLLGSLAGLEAQPLQRARWGDRGGVGEKPQGQKRP